MEIGKGNPRSLVGDSAMPREIHPRWNHGLIAASIAISLLGAFTSTQLMCQARVSRHFSGVLLWTVLGSLTFGFCSIWSLHEVAMLACELDVRVGIDVFLTTLSSVLAVFFTFTALASDMLWDRYKWKCSAKNSARKGKAQRHGSVVPLSPSTRVGESSEPLLHHFQQEDNNIVGKQDLELVLPPKLGSDERAVPEMNGSALPKHLSHNEASRLLQQTSNLDPAQPRVSDPQLRKSPTGIPNDGAVSSSLQYTERNPMDEAESDADVSESFQETSSDFTGSRRLSSFTQSDSNTFGFLNIMSIRTHHRSTTASMNAFAAVWKALYTGCTPRNICKGFSWSLAITSMHYVGIKGLIISNGYVSLNPILVVLSGVICWVVCLVGCILIVQIETNLAQQLLFSIVATCGVAAMHWTGMSAAAFWCYEPPSEDRGYPAGLVVAVVSIAIITCIGANGLLAHSATVSRNKLAEIVYTRRKLWMAIVQKEHAESAAAARSDFIASASHEIRTPLHHLQGYSDLLSQTELTEEGRLLLYAIQRATKTLSLITNNVLDWSRLEKDGEATCRPVALDIRTVLESVITLLPNQDDEVEAELLVVVAPHVPHSLFLDETYIHRVLMNLLSNALKFTSTGYILLLVEMKDGKMVASVSDTGCGIPPSFLPQLFDPFTQAQARGRQRGTGLGLSIIKQLLHKMQGTIEVDSKFQDSEDVGPDNSGSVFTITIPVQSSGIPVQASEPPQTRPRIAIFHCGNKRSLTGITMAWEKFDFDVVIAKEYSDVLDSNLKYIWADLPSLKQSPVLLRQLLEQDRCVTLVPYDMQSALHEIPGLLQAPQHFIPIQKPLIWHAIKKRIAAAGRPASKSFLPRTVRFDPNVEVLEQPIVKSSPSKRSLEEKAEERPAPRKYVVLLVEDNPINCKLGKKMLESLGYDVLIAEDGVEAIEKIVRHDQTVDVILMDQSMPRKDGLTATKEIREMEAAGTLSRRKPIIAVTAVVSAQAQALCKLAGTDDFLAKPLSLGKLEQTLKVYLEGRDR